MSRTPRHPRRPGRTGMVLALGLGLALTLGWAGLFGPGAAEFTTPPGTNVAAQEQLLRERVNRLARDLVGEALVDVAVSVGYVRTEAGRTGRQRVKLPGFNSYIANGGAGDTDIVPAYSRIRQVFVMVDENLERDARELERELRIAGNFDPAEGDWVRVVKVPAGERGRPAAMAAGPGEPEGGKPREPAREEPREPRRPEAEEPVDMLTEAESTAYLIRARQAFFDGDYDRALEQILASIERNPRNPQAYTMLGSLYYAMNWESLATKYWEQALELDPENRELRELLRRVR